MNLVQRTSDEKKEMLCEWSQFQELAHFRACNEVDKFVVWEKIGIDGEENMDNFLKMHSIHLRIECFAYRPAQWTRYALHTIGKSILPV